MLVVQETNEVAVSMHIFAVALPDRGFYYSCLTYLERSRLTRLNIQRLVFMSLKSMKLLSPAIISSFLAFASKTFIDKISRLILHSNISTESNILTRISWLPEDHPLLYPTNGFRRHRPLKKKAGPVGKVSQSATASPELVLEAPTLPRLRFDSPLWEDLRHSLDRDFLATPVVSHHAISHTRHSSSFESQPYHCQRHC
jgi:hypothetical protein